jgi:predicted DCC family thiol-disulfide oxidoreductase YuxK
LNRPDVAGDVPLPVNGAADGPARVSPEQAVIVFDGVCVLCNAWVRFLLRHDRAGRYRFSAMQSASGRALLAAHGLDAEDPASFLLIEGEHAFTDSEAITRVLAGLGGPWRTAQLIRGVPRPLRDAAYRWLARNRYRWFGRHAQCVVPTDAVRGRFLD